MNCAEMFYTVRLLINEFAHNTKTNCFTIGKAS